MSKPTWTWDLEVEAVLGARETSRPFTPAAFVLAASATVAVTPSAV
jgi:hypothetical protein